jgi:transposase
MLPIHSSAVIMLSLRLTDMRKNFDGLCAEVQHYLCRNPLSGELFVFVNKRCDRMKILVWDRHGFWLLYKRLETGRFQMPPREAIENPGSLSLSYEQLLMIIEGIDLTSVKRRKRFVSMINNT